LAYRFWKLSLKTSVLIGLATTMSNHMLFILPTAQNIYTGYIIDQIRAIIIAILKALTSERMSFFGVVERLSKNPLVWQFSAPFDGGACD